MLTAIRGDQIKLDQIHNGHVVGPTNSKFGGGIHHEKLNLTNSIVANFLNSDESVHRAVLDSHLVALWNVALAQAVSGQSMDVTTVILSTLSQPGVDAEETATMGTNQKGVLTTGTGTNGAGTNNYRVQIRDASTKDPVYDNTGGQVYGELTNNAIGGGSVGNYTLSFKKSDGSAYSMAAAEISKVDTVADVLVENPATGTGSPTYYHSLNGKYFRISSPTTDYYVWYTVSGEPVMDPAALNVGRTGIAVTVAPLATAADVAVATRTAIDATADFNATSSLGSVTVTNANAGIPISVLADGVGGRETGFAFQVLTIGAPTVVDFMFVEVFSYLTAPVMSFATGIGFADIVGIAGSHNHHDLYYTKIELESGQLDNRYFTKTQMDSGQLDNRYYTESELDPYPGTDNGDAKLDTRYFKESEITSTANGSSGAKLVGVTPTGSLASANVQDALVELQGDVDGILNGTLNINHSLDRAYDDGSIVAVDATDVDWRLTDTKTFKVTADTGATDVLKVTAGAVGDVVAINATLNETGTANFTGEFNQQTGIFKVNAGDAVDIDGTNITIDGVGASSLATTGAPLTVETKTSGNLTLRSATDLYLKDTNLTAALPLSQTGQTALSNKFNTATSVVGAINENAEDLYTLINTTLPSTVDSASGADQIGATGITGVIPTGGTLGGNATVQAMLEGIARGAAGGKVFPTIGTTNDGTETGDPTGPGSLLAEKATGMYFKANEIVYVKDVNRFVMVLAPGAGAVEGTDWTYLWSDLAPMAGPSFKVISDNVTVDTLGAFNVAVDNGALITDDSGAKFQLSPAGVATVAAAPGQVVSITSNTEVEINAGALFDVDAQALTLDGQLTATGAANQNMVIQTTGTGQVRLSAADEIDLTGGNIDINAGVGKTVTIDSDTEVAITSATVDIDGTTIVSIDAPIIETTGVLNQTGETHIMGNMNLDGAIDHDGASFDSNVTGAFNVTSDSTKVMSSGATLELNTSGAINATAATGQAITVTTDGLVDINAQTLDIDASGAATVDAASLTVTAAQDGNIIARTTGLGIVDIYSETRMDVSAPITQFYGDVRVVPEGFLSVDKIKITSVDPLDSATITGERSGTLNPINLFRNPGFEEGSGVDAAIWTEGPKVDRITSERYYGSYSINYVDATPAIAGESLVLEQPINGSLTDGGSYVVSAYIRGTLAKPLMVSAGDGTPVQLVATGNVSPWVRYEAVVTAGSTNDNLKFYVENTGGELADFFIDAMMLETGSGAASNYFTNYHSNLVMTIGDEDDDQIIFRSEGTATQDLVRIHQDHVFINGNLEVTGTTTTINTENLLVSDNNIVLNKDVTGVPALDAFYSVERGTSTDAQIKWNESTDKWELYNHQSNSFETIVTSATGDTTVSLDAAYNGGSSVTVDDTNVTWDLSATKKFTVSDDTDTAKFEITGGATADSVKIDTTGGIDIDADGSINIARTSGPTLVMTSDFSVTNSSGSLKMANGNDSAAFYISNNKAEIRATSGTGADVVKIASGDGIDIDASATGLTAIDTGSFSIDGVMDSNVTVTGADLTLSTVTSGTVNIDGATAVTIDAPAINTTGVLTQTGDTQVIGDFNLDGNFDQTGNYTFLVDTTATALNAVRINSAGGVDIDAASTVAVNAQNINTTGSLLQTGATQVVGNMNLDGDIDHDGASFDSTVSGNFGVTADTMVATTTGLAAITSGASVNIDAAADSYFMVDGASLTLATVTSGTVALASAGAVTFADQFQTNPISFSQTSADGFATQFAYNAQTDFDWTVRATGIDAITSVMGAVNANRQDLYEYVELLSTQGAAVGTAAGANLIGVDGITGVMPMDASFNPTGTVGADATLQEILNGLATSSGGGKTYANIAAFTSAKASGVYFKASEHVRILDTNRTVIVLTQSTAVAEGTDWDFLYGINRVMGGANFMVNQTGAIDLIAGTDFHGQGSIVAIDGTSEFSATGDNGNSSIIIDASGIMAITTATAQFSAVTFDLDGTTYDMDLSGAFLVDAAAPSHVNVTAGSLTLSTQTSGDINISSVGNIVESAVMQQSNVTTFDVNASGAFTLDGAVASYLRTTGANLNLQTVGSGEINFKDARMAAAVPLTDVGNAALYVAPGASAIASLFDAINRAYNNTGDTSKMSYYEAPSLSSTEAAQNWIQVSSDDGLFDGVAAETGVQNTGTGYNGQARYDLPGGTASDLPSLFANYQSGANLQLTPSQLRNNYGIFIAVYLNGLRLSDSEWVYVYDHTTGKKILSFNNSHAGVPEISWVTVNAVDAIALSASDHVVVEVTYNRTSQA